METVSICSSAALPVITITYINSGLTSLERGIRKTTAIMLLDLVSVHPTFIEIQFNQIITQMLTLLSEPLHVSGLSKQLDTDEYKDTGGGKQLAKKGGRQGNSNNSSGDSNSINTSSKQALMPIIIAILAAVLQDHNFTSSINSSSKPLCSLEYEESSIYNSTIIVRKKKRSFPVALLSLSAESTKIGNVGVDGGGSLMLAPSLSLGLVKQFKKIWLGLEMNPTALMKETVSIMQEMCGVLKEMLSSDSFSLSLLLSSSSEMISFLRIAFKNFPHKSYEGLTTEKSIESDRQFRYPVIALDMSLCHLAFVLSKKLLVDDSINTCTTVEEIEQLKYVDTTARMYVNDMLSETIERSSSVVNSNASTDDREDKRWFSVLVYLSTSRCKFYQFINDLMMDGLQVSSSSSSSSLSKDQYQYVDILDVLIQLISTSISCVEYAAGNSALETKFVRPALECVCELLESCELWDYFIENKGLESVLVRSDNDEEEMYQADSIVALLDMVCEKALPVWLQKTKDGNNPGSKYIDGVRRVVYSILAILRRQVSAKSVRMLSNCTLQRFFKPCTVYGHASSTAGKKKGSGDNTEKADNINTSDSNQQIMYHLFESEMRKAVLEAIYYCFPFMDNIAITIDDILNCVFSCMNSFDEPTYFLQILLQSKHIYGEGNGKDLHIHNIMKKSLQLALFCAIHYVPAEKESSTTDVDSMYASLVISTNTRKVLSFISEIIVYSVLSEDRGEVGEVICMEMMELVGNSVLLPGYCDHNSETLTWNEMLIRTAAVHSIVISALHQRYELDFTVRYRDDDTNDNDDDPVKGKDLSTLPVFATKCLEFYSKVFISLFCSQVIPSQPFKTRDSHSLGTPCLYVTDSIIKMFADIGAVFTVQVIIDTKSSADDCKQIEEGNKRRIFFTIDSFRETFMNFYEGSTHWSLGREKVMNCLRVMSDPELLKTLPRKKLKLMSDLEVKLDQDIEKGKKR